jgi:GNAT superfamily N-acetyltransferase
MHRLIFRRYDASAARGIRDTVAAIYEDSYIEAIASNDPFDSVGAFMGRFDAYTAQKTFDMVIACIRDEPVGQSWGWSLKRAASPGDREADLGFANEDRKATFALSEIMVRHAWQGQGIAHALHDELLSARTEQRAELFVEPGNTIAYRAYTRWGWRKVAETRPDLPDAPLFDVLVLPLPLAR